MRLVKSKGDGKYVLTFEIEPHEAAMGNLYEIWDSKKLTDFIDALEKMTKPQAEDPLERARRVFRDFNTNDPFQNQTRRRNPFDQGTGSFTQEQLNEYMRQAGWATNGFAGSTSQIPQEPAWAKTLGVKASATKDEIKAKYRSLAKVNHPDRGGDPAKFAKITEAYNEAMAVK